MGLEARAKSFLEKYEALCAAYGFLVTCVRDPACCTVMAVEEEEDWEEAAEYHLTILRERAGLDEHDGV